MSCAAMDWLSFEGPRACGVVIEAVILTHFLAPEAQSVCFATLIFPFSKGVTFSVVGGFEVSCLVVAASELLPMRLLLLMIFVNKNSRINGVSSLSVKLHRMYEIFR